MAFLSSCRHGDYCDRCSKCEQEAGIGNAIKRIKEMDDEHFNKESVLVAIDEEISKNEKELKDAEDARERRQHEIEMERIAAALMPDSEEDQ